MRVQPALKGPGLVFVQGAEDTHEGLLRKILGVMLVTREAVGQTVDTISMFSNKFSPRGHVTLASVERCGSGQFLGCCVLGRADNGRRITSAMSGLNTALLCGHDDHHSIVRAETPASAL